MENQVYCIDIVLVVLHLTHFWETNQFAVDISCQKCRQFVIVGCETTPFIPAPHRLPHIVVKVKN